MRWQAPELLNSSRFPIVKSGLTTASDVYAFSCVCIEVGRKTVFFGREAHNELQDIHRRSAIRTS